MAGKVRNYSFLKNYNHYVPTVADLFILLVWFILGILVGNVVTIAFTAAVGAGASQEYGMLVAYPMMFIPPMIYAATKSHSNSMNRKGIKMDSNNFAPKGAALCAVLVVLGTIALSFCADAAMAIMPDMPTWLEDILKGMTQGTVWVNFICVSIYAPLFEEWLCRGMVLRGMLANGMKPVKAIIISALVFAIIHANPWQAIPAFLLGLLFGYVYYKTGSLKLTMLMHFANNTFALTLGNIDSLKDMDSWMDVFPGGQYWLMFAGFLLIAGIVVKMFHDIPLQQERGNLDEVPALFEE